jgi:hypothetical protein
MFLMLGIMLNSTMPYLEKHLSEFIVHSTLVFSEKMNMKRGYKIGHTLPIHAYLLMYGFLMLHYN